MNDVKIPSRKQFRVLAVVAGTVLAWFALAEIATWAWYSMHESKLKKNPIPASGEALMERLRKFAQKQGTDQIREDDVGEAAREILNCSYAKTLSWAGIGRISAVTVIRWDDRSSAGGVESSHNPGVCLAAAGWSIGTRTELGFQEHCGVGAEVTEWQVSRPDIQMLAYSAVFRRFSGAPTLGEHAERNNLRWSAVFAGRRDAPVLIMLVYLSVAPGEQTGARERLDQIMRAALCTPAS